MEVAPIIIVENRSPNNFCLFTLVPDEPPVNITAKGIEPTVIKADWSPVPYETINGIGIGYKLAIFNINGYKIRNYILNASTLSLEITGLEIWTNYSIKMASFTVVGDGPWSDLILEDTDEEGKPQAAHPRYFHDPVFHYKKFAKFAFLKPKLLLSFNHWLNVSCF